jgi:hypothetical protein
MMKMQTSSADDFDVFIGGWHVHHRRLKKRLADCCEWVAFEGSSTAHKILGGFGNIDDNVLDLPDGPYRAATLRSFDPTTGLWSIWWLDGRRPHHLDTPVIGRFENGTGLFYADDTLDDTPIKVRFTWFAYDANTARWEQAFSDDRRNTWETNRTMDFARMAA